MHQADTNREPGDAFSLRLTTLERLLAIEATELRSALDQASDFLGEALGADKIDVFLYDPTTSSLVALGTSNTPMGRKQHALGLARMPLANGGRTVAVYQTGEPYWNDDVARDPEVVIGIREGLGVRSMIAVPLEVAGVQRGVLEAVSARPAAFSSDDRTFLKAVARWVGMIAHRAELVEQITRRAVAEAQQETAEEMVTVLAHDLGNHLTPLSGRIDLLRRRAVREGRALDQHDAEAANQALARLRNLIGDLLDVGRLEHGIFTLNQQPLDLCTLTAETVEMLRSAEQDIHLSGPDEVRITGDPARLRQVLENLLVNALKHSPAGMPIVVQLRDEQQADGSWAVLTIQDAGPGIPAELLPRLFQRFVAGPGSQGLGLGLYLAHRITVAHGGTLTVESAPGEGTRFHLALPLDDDSPARRMIG